MSTRKPRQANKLSELTQDLPILGEEISLPIEKGRIKHTITIPILCEPIIERFFKLEKGKGFTVTHQSEKISQSYSRALIVLLRDKEKGQQCRIVRMSPTSFNIFRIQ
jgi:hypothetical protein